MRVSLPRRVRDRVVHTYRTVSYALIERCENILLWLRLFWQTRLGLLEIYQPIYTHQPGSGEPALRECEDRLRAFTARLPDGPISVLDIGCNIGFFVLSLAQRGGICVGVDAAGKQILAAKAIAALNKAKNATFVHTAVTPENVFTLPRCDLVLCLSVFHHWVRVFGKDAACRMLQIVAEHTGRYLVFETGQPDEVGARWAYELEFMHPDADTWAQVFLREAGFAEVHNLGTFPTSVSNTPRHLFLAVRAS